MVDLEKNKRIGEARRATKARRMSQICKTFKFKVSKSSLKKEQKEHLRRLFIEAKWIYNYIVANTEMVFDIKDSYKNLKTITHKDKDKNDIPADILYFGSSMKQEMLTRIGNEIKVLATAKKKGKTVGKLKFKSEVNSIPLKQYGITHVIKGNKIRIQGIKEHIRVTGLKQLKKYDTIDYANAVLFYDGYDYYIILTCYINKELKENNYTNDIIGLDFGVKTSLTTSNGDKIDVSIKETERLKKLQAVLARKKYRSNNWYKIKSLIRKEYNHITNQKNDVANKTVHKLLSDNRIIVMQDEQIADWKSELTSEKIQHSILGRIKNKLMSSNRVIILDKWFPTTKYCSNCHSTYDINLSERTYQCPNSGIKEDRDIHAAKNMIYFYLNYKDTVGTTDTSKPVVIKYKQITSKQENTMSLALC